MRKADTAQLLLLADSALLPGESAATVTERIVSYSDAFDRWYSEAKPYLDAGDVDSVGGADLLHTLNERHGQVMELTRGLMERTDAETKGLRRKGRGLLAYTELLGKQVGSRKLPPG